MAEKGNRTFLGDLIDPEVLADMVSAKLTNKIRVSPFAKIDTTLQGRPGSTITVPVFGYIGKASVVAEGEDIPVTALTTSTVDYTVRKIGKGVTITDEALLSGYGNPQDEATSQLAKSIGDAIDEDSIDVLGKASNIYESASKSLGYEPIVDTIDLFQEEINSPKAMFIHPNQVKTLRKDANFLSADKYGLNTNVIMTGEIGLIANTRIVASKRVIKNPDFYKEVESTTSGALKIVADTATPDTGEIKLSDVKTVFPASYEPEVGDSVLKVNKDTYYINPIIKLLGDSETENEIPAITIFLKRDTSMEVERQSTKRQSVVTVDKHYVAALTNDSKAALLFAKA